MVKYREEVKSSRVTPILFQVLRIVAHDSECLISEVVRHFGVWGRERRVAESQKRLCYTKEGEFPETFSTRGTDFTTGVGIKRSTSIKN